MDIWQSILIWGKLLIKEIFTLLQSVPFVILLIALIFRKAINEKIRGIKQVASVVKNTEISWLNILLGIIAFISMLVAVASNQRAEKLFGSQIRPLIQDRPIAISRVANTKFVKTTLAVANYSGFNAYNITFDLKYSHNNVWVGEWIKARINHLEKKEDRTDKDNQELRDYRSMVRPITILKARSSINRTVDAMLPKEDIEKGVNVIVRTTWDNKRGHTFDAIHKYTLTYTVADDGLSFTFIPQEILSHE